MSFQREIDVRYMEFVFLLLFNGRQYCMRTFLQCSSHISSSWRRSSCLTETEPSVCCANLSTSYTLRHGRNLIFPCILSHYFEFIQARLYSDPICKISCGKTVTQIQKKLCVAIPCYIIIVTHKHVHILSNIALH
jgi:hypothetical protein